MAKRVSTALEGFLLPDAQRRAVSRERDPEERAERACRRLTTIAALLQAADRAEFCAEDVDLYTLGQMIRDEVGALDDACSEILRTASPRVEAANG